MSSNEGAMTLEDKLVQRIKGTPLSTLMDDEDALVELTRRAIREALFQPVRTPTGYGRHEETASPVVTAAREVAKKAADKVVAELVSGLAEDPAFAKALRAVLADSLPVAIRGQLGTLLDSMASRGAVAAVNTLADMVRAGRPLDGNTEAYKLPP